MSAETSEILKRVTFSGMSVPQVPTLKSKSVNARWKINGGSREWQIALQEDDEVLQKYVGQLVKYYEYVRLSSLRASTSYIHQRKEYLDAIWQRRERIFLLLKLQYLKQEVIYRQVSDKKIDKGGLYSTLSNANHMIGTEHFNRVLSKQHLKQSDPWDGTKYKLLSYHSLYLQLSKKLVLEILRFHKQQRLLVYSLVHQDVTTGTGNSSSRTGLLKLAFYAIRHESIRNRQVTHHALCKTYTYLSNKHLRYAFLYLRRQTRYSKRAILSRQLARTSHHTHLSLSFFKRLYALYDHRAYRRKMRVWSEDTRKKSVLVHFFYAWTLAYVNVIALKRDLYKRASKGISPHTSSLNLPSPPTLLLPHHPSTPQDVTELLNSCRRRKFSEFRQYLALRSMRKGRLRVLGGVGEVSDRRASGSDYDVSGVGNEMTDGVVEDRLKQIQALYPSYSKDSSEIGLRPIPSSLSTPHARSAASAEVHQGDIPLARVPSPKPPSPPSVPAAAVLSGVDEGVLLNLTPLPTVPPSSSFRPNGLPSYDSVNTSHVSNTTPTHHINGSSTTANNSLHSHHASSARRLRPQTPRSSPPSILDRAVEISVSSSPLTPAADNSATPAHLTALKGSRRYTLKEYVYVNEGDLGKKVVTTEVDEDDEVVRHPSYSLIRRMFLKFKVCCTVSC